MRIARVLRCRVLRATIPAALACALVLSAGIATADERTGEQIYREMCASCHGAGGEGTEEKHPDPLAGDKSVAQLADLIAETMPEDDPGTCTGEDAKRVAHAAERVRRLGVGLSLDDFGTGHASMEQLQVLPLTEVKIDKRYVAGLTGDASKRAIVKSIHQLATALGLSIVAEGVEDEDTAAAVARLPDTIGQGWHFGRPVPADVFREQWHGR